jgi:hypothetical protein
VREVLVPRGVGEGAAVVVKDRVCLWTLLGAAAHRSVLQTVKTIPIEV